MNSKLDALSERAVRIDHGRMLAGFIYQDGDTWRALNAKRERIGGYPYPALAEHAVKEAARPGGTNRAYQNPAAAEYVPDPRGAAGDVEAKERAQAAESPAPPSSPVRTGRRYRERLELRLTPADAELLREAARAAGVGVSTFVRLAAVRAADLSADLRQAKMSGCR